MTFPEISCSGDQVGRGQFPLAASLVSSNIKGTHRVNSLAKVFVLKLAATVLFWCLPLILLPQSVLEAAGFPVQSTYLFVRLLGWAYLALCVGYVFGLKAALRGRRDMSVIWVGVVSNGGACVFLAYFALHGAWASWGGLVQWVGWGSILATAGITAGLYVFGVRGTEPASS